MKKLLIVLSLVIAVSVFGYVNTNEALAMNKAELIDAIGGDANLSKADAKRALEALTSSVASELRKGNSVQLVGFGSFSISKRAARKLAAQDGLSPRERGCLWLTSRAPEWLHSLFCTVSNDAIPTEMVALMLKSADPDSKPFGLDEAHRFLDSFGSTITDQLVIRDVITIEDFGDFSVREGRGRRLNTVEFDSAPKFVQRIGRNPQTGKEIKIAGKNVVKFKAGADLAKKVN
ncbi:HU family DNA-binding protein [Dehalococcoides mccartyi]|nr:HU family DNA-binding protein [Dehalococcoides mccartyi]